MVPLVARSARRTDRRLGARSMTTEVSQKERATGTPPPRAKVPVGHPSGDERYSFVATWLGMTFIFGS